jgi:hypothetical protein
MRRTMGPSKRVNSKDVCFLSDLISNSSDALGEIGYKSITQLEKSEAQLQCDEVRTNRPNLGQLHDFQNFHDDFPNCSLSTSTTTLRIRTTTSMILQILPHISHLS